MAGTDRQQPENRPSSVHISWQPLRVTFSFLKKKKNPGISGVDSILQAIYDI